MFSNPPFDMTTTTSPGCRSATIVSMMRSAPPTWRAFRPALQISSTRSSTDNRSASGSVERNTVAMSVSSAAAPLKALAKSR